MNIHSESGAIPENSPCQQWGLESTITPCFGARLVQEGDRLHFLADRAGFNGAFSDEHALRLDQAFPLILKQLELMLTSEADTLGSCGYVFIAIYPEHTEPQ